MKRQTFCIIRYALLLIALVFLLKVFLPGSYDVASLQKRPSTKHWSLTTGSQIGYTLIDPQGNAKPYPVIFLHGGPGGHITDRDIETLRPLSFEGYNVYLYDQVGSGHSNRLKDIGEYTVSRHILDLQQIIKQTGSEKVILIGQSWGAILALLFAAENPGKVDRIIFTCPGPVFPRRNELASIKAPDSFKLREPVFTNAQANKKVNNIRTDLITFLAKNFRIKLASDKEVDNFQTFLNSELNKSTVCDSTKIIKAEAGGGFYAQIMTFKNLLQIQDARPRIRNSRIPVLVMKGQCDNQKWGFTREYLELFPNHQLSIIPGAGHFISVEQPQLYTNAIKDFLNRKIL